MLFNPHYSSVGVPVILMRDQGIDRLVICPGSHSWEIVELNLITLYFQNQLMYTCLSFEIKSKMMQS